MKEAAAAGPRGENVTAMAAPCVEKVPMARREEHATTATTPHRKEASAAGARYEQEVMAWLSGKGSIWRGSDSDISAARRREGDDDNGGSVLGVGGHGST